MIRPVRGPEAQPVSSPLQPIPRAGVVATIAEAAAYPITVIAAPAGYGKTTALDQFLADNRGEIVRFDISASETTLRSFVRGFAAAIGPDAAKSVGTALDSAENSPTPTDDLTAWLHTHLRAYTGTVVLDDLHRLETEPDALRVVLDLIERTAKRTRWIIATRSSAMLPIGTWLAYQQMHLVIDEGQLAFSNHDATALAAEARVRISSSEMTEILELTDGWPLALAYALRTAQRLPDALAVTTATRDMTYRYLAEQIYQTLSESERTLLAMHLGAREIVCDVARDAGIPAAGGIIEGLRHKGAFIAMTDHARRYRIHDLFRAFLDQQIRHDGIDVSGPTTALAQAYARTGNVLEALRIATYADLVDLIAELLREHGVALIEGGTADVVAEAIDRLVARDGHPAIVFAMRGLLLDRAGRFDEADAALRRALREPLDPALRASLQLARARIAVNTGTEPSELLALEEDIDLPRAPRIEAGSIAAVAFARRLERGLAGDTIDRTLRGLRDITTRSVRARVLQRIGTAETEIGRYDAALEHLDLASKLATEEGLLSLAARAYQGLCNVIWLTSNDQARYAWFAQQATLMATKAGDRLDLQQSLSRTLNTELRRGNAIRAAELEQQLAAMRTAGHEKTNVRESEALRAAWEGRFADALATIERTWPEIYFPSERAIAGSLCALYAVFAKEPERAKHIIATVADLLDLHRADPAFSGTNRSISHAFLAIAQACLGRMTVARQMLARFADQHDPAAIALWATVERLLPLLKTPNPEEGLVEALAPLQERSYGGWARLLQVGIQSRAHGRGSGGNKGLTLAEADLLRRLANGGSERAIALETGKSLSTIQTHRKNAFAKLGCHNRADAIAEARKRGIIDAPTPAGPHPYER